MIDEMVKLRNRIHSGAFMFDLTPDLWELHYIYENARFITIKDDVLRGYAVVLLEEADMRTYYVLELCAESEEIAVKLIDEILEMGKAEDVDVINIKPCDDKVLDSILDKRRCLSMVSGLIMVALTSPRDLLKALSTDVKEGVLVELSIQGFTPIKLVVGKRGFKVVENSNKPCVVIRMDAKTFLRIFFNKVSFWRAWLAGKIKIDKLRYIMVAHRFFKFIRHERWYIPPGDYL